jgi:hypothetical protein
MPREIECTYNDSKIDNNTHKHTHLCVHTMHTRCARYMAMNSVQCVRRSVVTTTAHLSYHTTSLCQDARKLVTNAHGHTQICAWIHADLCKRRTCFRHGWIMTRSNANETFQDVLCVTHSRKRISNSHFHHTDVFVGFSVYACINGIVRCFVHMHFQEFKFNEH